MDPQILAVLTGIIANGLTSVIAQVGRKGGKFLTGEELLNKIKLNETALVPIIHKAIDDVAEEIKWEGPPRIEEVCLFLSSPEVEAIVRQIYASKLLAPENNKNLDLIRQELLASLSLYSGVPKVKIEDKSKILWNILIESCENSFQLAINAGILSARDAKSSFRHRIVLDELDSIKKNLHFLTSIHKPKIKEFLDFEEKYRRQVGSRHSHITPPHFDAVRKIPIDNLYVASDFLSIPLRKNDKAMRLNMNEFLSVIYRVVIVGNPGSGKSTFTHRLCYDLSTNYPRRVLSGRRVTPILVVLREYGAEKKEHKSSILQFIESTANSKYQILPPQGAFEYLLHNERVMVIFDGLDELLDTSYRQEISGDVESFCKFYPSVPVLVTSREVGYEQAPLDEKMFEIFRISDFNEEQVTEYAKKWFSIESDLSREQKEQKAEAFYNESKIVPDLRSNPLMLALMCNIYRGENYIPRNRPDVYEKCATMLFERWDKSRGIHVTLPFESHIKPSMMYLAHWIYSVEAFQGGVTEQNLVERSTEYLCPKRFEDRDEAEKAAREFIDFCRNRAWVFTDTGTTKEGERLYQFTHRTFLEYFTACHLVRTNPTPDRLGEVLLPKIAQREWDVVAQLVFQLQNKNVEGAGDELLNLLITKRQKKKDNAINMLSFAVRCLEFLVPSPQVTRSIVERSIEFAMTRGLEKLSQSRKSLNRVADHENEILFNLLVSASENRPTIANSIEKLITERSNSSDEKESFISLQIGLNLNFSNYSVRRRKSVSIEIMLFWEELQKKIANICREQIKLLSVSV